MRLPLFIIAVCLIVPCPSEGLEDFCPQPPKKNHTKPLLADCVGNGEDSCRVNDTLRYHCEDGYVRKAGTSGLIKCQLVNHRLEWREAKASIVCICKGTTYDVCPADSSQTPTMPPSECPEDGRPKASEGSTLAPDVSPPSETTPSPTMHLSGPTVPMKAGPQTFPIMPSSEATLPLEIDPLSPTTPALAEPARESPSRPSRPPRTPPAQTQGPEMRTADCSTDCVSTPTPGESPSPESGTAVSPARILSTKEKISIGAAGGLFIMIVAAVGFGIHLNHNRGAYARAGQDEPVSLGTLGNTPVTPSPPPQEL